ncbi:hypothetical protein Z961_04215 [Clostridium haemolyticum NCTC 8350]|uniref:hypothetical protein n=1 Tax=Clostridium haemolyticum TaxID=84025 RepID=UPI00052C00F2|nr:hypothetical protein [Clostridium haemolyticum]KGN04163.1 hypothetical protein Z961_04215 [Clostridium haemolyticum NCTC 8350]
MVYKKINFKDRIDTKPTTYLVDGKPTIIEKDNTGVKEEGSNLNAENLNHLEEGIFQNSKDIETLKIKNTQEIEEFKNNTKATLEENKKDTDSKITNLERKTTQEIKDFKQEVNSQYEEFKKEANTIKDTKNNKKYKWGVENGLVYIEEVEK